MTMKQWRKLILIHQILWTFLVSSLNVTVSFQPTVLLWQRIVKPNGQVAFQQKIPIIRQQQQRQQRQRQQPQCKSILLAGIGNDDQPPSFSGSRGGSDDDSDNLKKFLDPSYRESDNLRKAREFVSENALPLNYNKEYDENDTKMNQVNQDNETTNITSATNISPPYRIGTNNGGNPTTTDISSAITRPPDNTIATASNNGGDTITAAELAANPYLNIVSKITPSELISKFTSTAHPKVQDAVRTTIIGMLGGLSKMSFETTTVTTGQRLASLMFQLQMTGYMFKNAEYRLSLQQSLGIDDYTSFTNNLLPMGKNSEDENDAIDPLAGKVRGKLRIKYNLPSLSPGRESKTSIENVDNESSSSSSSSSSTASIEVDAAAYMSELRSEVAKLRDELVLVQKTQEEDASKKDLLTFIRTLPAQELKSLTSTMSPDVLVAMKGLINAVMAGIGDGNVGPYTVVEQSGESMAQLCMWQLVSGYNLRTLEVREEMKKSLQISGTETTSSSLSGILLLEDESNDSFA